MTLEPPKSSWYIIFQWNFLANARSPGPWCTTTSVLLTPTSSPTVEDVSPSPKIGRYIAQCGHETSRPNKYLLLSPRGRGFYYLRCKTCAIKWPLSITFLWRFTACTFGANRELFVQGTISRLKCSCRFLDYEADATVEILHLHLIRSFAGWFKILFCNPLNKDSFCHGTCATWRQVIKSRRWSRSLRR